MAIHFHLVGRHEKRQTPQNFSSSFLPCSSGSVVLNKKSSSSSHQLQQPSTSSTVIRNGIPSGAPAVTNANAGSNRLFRQAKEAKSTAAQSHGKPTVCQTRLMRLCSVAQPFMVYRTMCELRYGQGMDYGLEVYLRVALPFIYLLG